MANICKSISCFLIIALFAITVSAQKKQPVLKVTNCEEAKAILDVALVDAINLPDHYIFLFFDQEGMRNS